MQVPALALGVVQPPGDLGAHVSRQVVEHHVDLERHTAASSAQPRQNVFEPTGASATARQARSEAASNGAAVATRTQEGWHLTQRCWRSADHSAAVADRRNHSVAAQIDTIGRFGVLNGLRTENVNVDGFDVRRIGTRALAWPPVVP